MARVYSSGERARRGDGGGARVASGRLRALFWLSAASLTWTQLLYGAFLAALVRLRPPAARSARPADDAGREPFVSLIIAAYREEAVIAAKVANALALDWPREKLEIIVAVDGDVDATAERAR